MNLCSTSLPWHVAPCVNAQCQRHKAHGRPEVENWHWNSVPVEWEELNGGTECAGYRAKEME